MRRTSRIRGRRRAGVAIIELAVCLPAIVLLVLASIEACTMIFVKQSMHIAAYESVRTAIKHDGTKAAAVARAEQILSERNVKNATVKISPSKIDEADPGKPVRVEVKAPTLDNTIMKLRFFSGDLETEVTMAKE